MAPPAPKSNSPRIHPHQREDPSQGNNNNFRHLYSALRRTERFVHEARTEEKQLGWETEMS